MKIKEDIRKLTSTQQNLAKALGITPERCRQMIHEGIVIRDELDNSGGVYIFESLKRYFNRDKQETQEVDYTYEHAKLEQVKRMTAELRLEQARGNLYDASTVEQVITSDLVKIRTQILSLPAKLSVELEGKDKEDINDILTRELESALLEISRYKPELFKKADEPDEV